MVSSGKEKKVRFEAYLIESGKEKVDISNLLEQIKTLDNSNREMILHGLPVRIDKIEELSLDDDTIRKNNKLKLIYFHMSKLRDVGIATTKQQQDELKDLDLDDDEYIAEDIGCIFDTENCVLFIQRNFYCLSPTGICSYLKEMSDKFDNEQIDLELKPIPDKSILEKIEKIDDYRGIELSFAYDQYQNSDNTKIFDFLGDFGPMFENIGKPDVLLALRPGKSSNNPFKKDGSKNLSNEIIKRGNSIFF